MAKAFPNFMKITNPQIQEAQQTLKTRNMKKTTLRHNLINGSKLQ